MKYIRAVDPKTGETISAALPASIITDATRRLYNYFCRNPDCSARFHWVQPARTKENTEIRGPAFRINTTSQHSKGCRFAFENAANSSVKPAPVFFDGQHYHIRALFPLGASWTDRHPEKGRLTHHQRQVAACNTDKFAVNSLSNLVHLVEKRFGGVRGTETNKILIHYQGETYPWQSLFAGPENYHRLFETATAPEEKTPPLFLLARLKREIAASAKDRRRFACERIKTRIDGKTLTIEPVLVCMNDQMGAALSSRPAETVLMAAGRPFISREVLEKPRLNNEVIRVSFALFDPGQMARATPHNRLTRPAAQSAPVRSGPKE